MYEWQGIDLQNMTLRSMDHLQSKLEARRKQLLQQLPFDDDLDESVIDHEVVDEWIALLKERDKVSRMKVQHVVQHQFYQHVSELNTLLQKIDNLGFDEAPKAFRRGVQFLLKESKLYMAASKESKAALPEEEMSPQILRDRTESMDSPGSDIAPFTPLKLPDFSNIATTRFTGKSVQFPAKNRSERKRSPQKSKVKTPKSVKKLSYEYIPDTPRTSERIKTESHAKTPRFDEDLRKSLLKSKDKLRHTPGVSRSPGGTPIKKKRRLDLGDTSDLVTYALRKKFDTMRKLYGSPSTEQDASLNISID